MSRRAWFDKWMRDDRGYPPSHFMTDSEKREEGVTDHPVTPVEEFHLPRKVIREKGKLYCEVEFSDGIKVKVSRRGFNALKVAQVNNMHTLSCMVGYGEMEKYRNVGPKTIEELEGLVEKHRSIRAGMDMGLLI
jgi:hypothetical protein